MRPRGPRSSLVEGASHWEGAQHLHILQVDEAGLELRDIELVMGAGPACQGAKAVRALRDSPE